MWGRKKSNKRENENVLILGALFFLPVLQICNPLNSTHRPRLVRIKLAFAQKYGDKGMIRIEIEGSED